MVSTSHFALRAFLDSLLRRTALGPEEQQAILDLRGHAVQAQAHRDIVSPGQRVEHSCLVAEGLVARFDQMSDGRRQIVAFHIPGDMCDLHSLAVPLAGWGMEALTPSTVLLVPHSELWAAASAYPAIALAFWRDTTADGAILAKWASNLGRRDALSRLAHLLCETGLRMEAAGLGTRTRFVFLATQAQIADAMGLTSVHVNRMLQELRRMRVVRTEHRTIHVEDWDRLASIAEFDPAYLLLGRPSRDVPSRRAGAEQVSNGAPAL